MEKTIGLVGCGVIGTELAVYADRELKDRINKIVLYDTDPQKSATLVKKLSGVVVAGSIEEIVAGSDLVVEAAAPGAVAEILRMAIANKKDAMIMSVGGILGNEGLLYDAEERGVKILVPSGAIAGIDAVKAAKQAGLESVTITTRKPPKSIKGAPFLAENNIDIDKITEETVIFEGNAEDAIKGFPKNVNVSALLSISGLGPERTKVRIVISPEYTRNSHEIEVKGKAGTIRTRTENVPSPDNPKTSYLAALAAIAALRGYFDSVRIGT
ncbi:MAG: aspartate dehydrogenase [Candidatus Omnitrophota bacterium]|jgi:aspartate dehydrogenase